MALMITTPDEGPPCRACEHPSWEHQGEAGCFHLQEARGGEDWYCACPRYCAVAERVS